MITVEKALELVKSNTAVTGKTKHMQLKDTHGYVLSETIYSPINMPPFRQSAMDGYALCLAGSNEYVLIDEVLAGDGNNPLIKPGEAVRIFTGAPVPDSADAVVMQEKVEVVKNKIIPQTPIAIGNNIRAIGEQVSKGGIALKKGTKLSAAAQGYLAGLGVVNVRVFDKPSIAIIVTGNELIEPGEDLTYGRIYESNSKMLVSALHSQGQKDVVVLKIKDNYVETKQLLERCIAEKDIVLITGGISVGDYDFVGKALNELNVEQIFYKVNQKPGKPLFFGKRNNTVVFALPGNPSAALTCFYVYVYPAIESKSGLQDFSLLKVKAKSLVDYRKKGDRAIFLKAILGNDGVEILGGQSSAMLNTFSISNALVYMSTNENEIEKGEQVNVICLPN